MYQYVVTYIVWNIIFYLANLIFGTVVPSEDHLMEMCEDAKNFLDDSENPDCKLRACLK